MAGMFDVVVEKIIALQEAIDKWIDKLPASMEPYVEILKSPIDLPFTVNAPFTIRVLTAIVGMLLGTYLIIVILGTLGLFFPGKTMIMKWESQAATKLYEKKRRKEELKAFKLYKKANKSKDNSSDININDSAILDTCVDINDIINKDNNINDKIINKDVSDNEMGFFKKDEPIINKPTNVIVPKNLRQRKELEFDDESDSSTPIEEKVSALNPDTILSNMTDLSPKEYKKAKKEQAKREKKERKELLKKLKLEQKKKKLKSSNMTSSSKESIVASNVPNQVASVLKPNNKPVQAVSSDSPSKIVAKEEPKKNIAATVAPMVKKGDPKAAFVPTTNRSKRNSFDYLDELIEEEPKITLQATPSDSIHKTNTIESESENTPQEEKFDLSKSLPIDEEIYIDKAENKEQEVLVSTKEAAIIPEIEIHEESIAPVEESQEEFISPEPPKAIESKGKKSDDDDDLNDFFSSGKDKEVEVKVDNYKPTSVSSLGDDESGIDESEIKANKVVEVAKESIAPKQEIQTPKTIIYNASINTVSNIDDEIGDIDNIEDDSVQHSKVAEINEDDEIGDIDSIAKEIEEQDTQPKPLEKLNLDEEDVNTLKKEVMDKEIEDDEAANFVIPAYFAPLPSNDEEIIIPNVEEESTETDIIDSDVEEELTADNTIKEEAVVIPQVISPKTVIEDVKPQPPISEAKAEIINKKPDNAPRPTNIKVQESGAYDKKKMILVLKQDTFDVVEYKGKFLFILRSENGEAVFTSRDYKTLPSCMSGIQTFKKNVRIGEFIIEKDKFGLCRFQLSTNNNLVKYYGEIFRTQEECIDNIQDIKRLSQIIPIFEVSETDDNKYVFDLIADTGDVIFNSREYKSLTSCMSGALTFKKNVSDGIFEICKDEESNCYRFILTSLSNNLVKYYGMPFPDEECCNNNIAEVKEFAEIAQIKVRGM